MTPSPSLTRSTTLSLGLSIAFALCASAVPSIRGELKQWHKVTIDFTGPESFEAATPNPFTDYRLDLRFRHGDEEFLVPGYYAADGNAANTGANSGPVWRVHFAPNQIGRWEYEARFVTGRGVAAGAQGKSAGFFDGAKGAFEVARSDKTGRDLRGRGRLGYVGKHHLRFANGDYFLKCGADAPENFLAYAEFDGDFKDDGQKDNLIKTWQPHVRDWRDGDPTWQDGKGKGIIGAVNYLADQGLNAFSFLTLNIEGDDRNVFPYTNYKERERLDCSRLDQWEILFEHATRRGMYLHFKTQEAENVNLLDGGHVGPQRKLYYRELIARFGHHLALNWNLGEEVGYQNKVGTQKKKDWAAYFWNNDPYQHHIVIHNGNNHHDLLGPAESGGSHVTGFSLQTNKADFSRVHDATLDYIRRSVEAGKPWVVACDEPGDATHSLITDAEDPTRDNARKNALWGNLMAGGTGVEWYFGYAHPHSDLTCQDYRVREKMWRQSRVALEFFADHEIPFWNMTNANGKVSTKGDYCLHQAGELYLVFLKHAKPTTLDLSDAEGIFELMWFNPRDGGALQPGSTLAVSGGGKVALGSPPNSPDQDWLVVVRPGDPDRDYPPGVSAGADKSVMLPRSGKPVTVELDGSVSDDAKGWGSLSSKWTKISGPGTATFEDAAAPATKVSLPSAGEYKLGLSANDGKQETGESITITVEPFQARVTRAFRATDKAYIEGSNVFSNQYLKVEGDRRISLIKFDLHGLPPNILDAQLRLTGAAADSGGGKLRVFRGSHSDWAGKTLKKPSAPVSGDPLGMKSVAVLPGESITIPVPKLFSGDGTYTLMVTLDKGGDDIWFSATGDDSGPELLITFEDPDGRYSEAGTE